MGGWTDGLWQRTIFDGGEVCRSHRLFDGYAIFVLGDQWDMAVDPVSRWEGQFRRRQSRGSCRFWIKLVHLECGADPFHWDPPERGRCSHDACQCVPMGCYDPCDVDDRTDDLSQSP